VLLPSEFISKGQTLRVRLIFQGETNFFGQEHPSCPSSEWYSAAGIVSSLASGEGGTSGQIALCIILVQVTFRYYIGMLSFLNEDFAKVHNIRIILDNTDIYISR